MFWGCFNSQVTMVSRMVTNWNIPMAATTTANFYPISAGNNSLGVKPDEKKHNLLSVTMKPNSPIGIRSVRCCCRRRLPNPFGTDAYFPPLSAFDRVLVERFKKRPLYDRGTVAVVEVLLEDNNEVFWNELKKLCEDFSSSDNSSSTDKLLSEMIYLLVKHDKHWIHTDDRLVDDPWMEVPMLRGCQWAEFDVHDIRKRGKWFRWLMSGPNSNTVFVSLLACVDKEVGLMEYSGYVKDTCDDHLSDVVAKLCKDDRPPCCLKSLIRMHLQPGIMLYASKKADFGRSPPIFFKAGPCDIEKKYRGTNV